MVDSRAVNYRFSRYGQRFSHRDGSDVAHPRTDLSAHAEFSAIRDSLIQDCRFEGHLAHIDTALQSAPENLPEIAKQLGVAHILEGRVQKSGDAVRVNVQLIRAANDSQLWADTFDRQLTDIFSVESEMAKAIAESVASEAHRSGRASHRCQTNR